MRTPVLTPVPFFAFPSLLLCFQHTSEHNAQLKINSLICVLNKVGVFGNMGCYKTIKMVA